MLMNMDNIITDPKDWRKAGAIAATALRYGRDQIRVGASMLEVLNSVENKVEELGGVCAWAQMSFGDVAAHDCADPEDDRTIPETLVKIDVGASYNGALGDCAWTVDLTGKYGDFVKASQDALKAAIETAKPGVELREVGAAIEMAIAKYQLKPIRNLSGHGLARYTVHMSPTVPNFDNGNTNKLEKGMIIAIEPFVTDGDGFVNEMHQANVFMQVAKKNVRSTITRQVLQEIEKREGLPFTPRYYTEKFGEGKVNLAIKDLLNQGIIRAYPPLKERSGGMVAQFENTLYIGDETEVLTKPLEGHEFDDRYKEFI